jgi:hypothetical protein
MLDVYDHAHDLRYLNAAPPTDPMPAELVRCALDHLTRAEGDTEHLLQRGVASAARLLGREWDEIAEQAQRRTIALRPESWSPHYNLGLFFKTRGRFAEGVQANQAAQALGGAEIDSVQWNLGICATGAGMGELALELWRAKGNHLELGRFDLPEGGYDSVMVRLAERPLAERGPGTSDDPGEEETIWVERLSPCHGIIRSVLYKELGVNYGDVVLFDGAPITYRKFGDDKVAVFPHLATLRRQNYRTFDFVGMQQQPGEIENLSEDLLEDAVVYSHTEQLFELCRTCWENTEIDHADHERAEQHVVRGKVCAPPTVSSEALLSALDAGVAKSPGMRLFVPELCREAGHPARAEVERRRMGMIPGGE